MSHEHEGQVDSGTGAKTFSAVGGFVGTVVGSSRGPAGAAVGGLVGGTVGYLAGAALAPSPTTAVETEPVSIDVAEPAGDDGT